MTRTIAGDRAVDGTALAFTLDAWGQQGGCEPAAMCQCSDLGDLVDGAAAK